MTDLTLVALLLVTIAVLTATCTLQSWVILTFWQRQGYMPPPLPKRERFNPKAPQKLPDNVDLTAFNIVNGADDTVSGADEPPVF